MPSLSVSFVGLHRLSAALAAWFVASMSCSVRPPPRYSSNLYATSVGKAHLT